MTGSWIDVESQNIRQEMGQLIDSGKLKVLSTISGYQEGDRIFIVYHLINQDSIANVRTSVPMSDLRIDSISTILPGATLYEREIQDLLGVKFEGIIDNRRLILPEHWPNGVYPLRKDYKVSREEQQNG